MVKVSDNGVGLPENFNLESFNSLGLEIVCSLVEQVDGEISFDTKQGTTFTIVISKKEQTR